MDLLTSAEAELAEIERKIADMQPLIVRRDQLRTFINIGRTLYAAPPGQESMLPAVVSRQDHQRQPTQETDRVESKKTRIVETAAALIAAHGPLQTRDLLAHMLAQGIDVGGANKIDTISVALSRTKDRFKSDRAAGGWTLLQPHKEATPPGAPTPAGS